MKFKMKARNLHLFKCLHQSPCKQLKKAVNEQRLHSKN